MNRLSFNYNKIEGVLSHNGTEIFNLICAEYPLEYRLAEKRRPVYYHISNKRLPINIVRELNISIFPDSNGFLCLDDLNPKPILKNVRTVGTPRDKKINHQDFYSGGAATPFKRIKIKEQLGHYFIPLIVKYLPAKIDIPEGYFLHLEYVFYFPFNEYNPQHVPDIDNHSFIYQKIFKDMLTELKIIPGDDFRYVRGDYPRYEEVTNSEDRRLEIRFHLCPRHHGAVPRIFTSR